MSDMTVKESMRKKQLLRVAIIDLLANFSKETGLKVDTVDIDCSMNHATGALTYVVGVEVKLR